MLEIKSREEEAILLEHEQALLLREKLALEKAVSYNLVLSYFTFVVNVFIVFLLLGGAEKTTRPKTKATGI